MGTRIRYDTFFSNRPNLSGFLAMRHLLIPVLLLGLVAGCSSLHIGPHRIDVQQGNALDQENVARLKPGLNRSQVRFLLGTPLLVDPFRTDRWDYVYVYYKAGKLAEQKHISLFFEGDTLTRMEGDLPVLEPAAQPPAAPVQGVQTEPKAETPASPSAASVGPMSAPPAPQAAPVPEASVRSEPAAAPKPAAAPVATAATVAAPATRQTTAPTTQPKQAATKQTSIVPPLSSPKKAPASVEPRSPSKMSLQPETDVAQLKPDVMPPFPEPRPAVATNDEPILKALNDWVSAWTRRDDDAFIAAYDASFVPQGGGSRADWEKRRRLLMDVAKNIEVRIDSPSIDRASDGMATVTFNQFYRSDSYRDAVVKQLRMVDRDGRWLIVDEKVLSTLRVGKP
jgi:outer membrane protein assembly factor BamE